MKIQKHTLGAIKIFLQPSKSMVFKIKIINDSIFLLTCADNSLMNITYFNYSSQKLIDMINQYNIANHSILPLIFKIIGPNSHISNE